MIALIKEPNNEYLNNKAIALKLNKPIDALKASDKAMEINDSNLVVLEREVLF